MKVSFWMWNDTNIIGKEYRLELRVNGWWLISDIYGNKQKTKY
jgi:hypothetical protein